MVGLTQYFLWNMHTNSLQAKAAAHAKYGYTRWANSLCEQTEGKNKGLAAEEVQGHFTEPLGRGIG